MFIPAHLAEQVVVTSEVVRLRDLFGISRLKEGKYTPGQIDNKWSEEIEKDFKIAKEGILKLPKESRLGVYLAYKYYSNLLKKIVHTPAIVLKENRIRVSTPKKISILLQSYLRHKLNLV